MGKCFSTEEAAALQAERQRSKELEQDMMKAHNRQDIASKLLLLGAGESGKSTLFKQMKNIYGNGFTDEERQEYTSVIYNNVLVSMRTLCLQASVLGFEVHPELEPSVRLFLEDLRGEEFIDENLAAHIQVLWEDPGIQSTYEERHCFQLFDSARYFFDKIEEIGREDYVPTDQDVLRSRIRTTGIVETEYTIDDHIFRMYDVGGQRNERKKWIHCFENVTAVIFVAAISEYDQILYEDEQTNRLHEAFQLFSEVCNLRWFARTAIILFLNKCDLFEEKIERVPLSRYFPDFPGPDNEFEPAIVWMTEQFAALNANPSKQVYAHVTCATDINNVTVVFNTVKDIVIRRSLTEAGLV